MDCCPTHGRRLTALVFLICQESLYFWHWQKVKKWKSLSCFGVLVTLWTAAWQASLTTEFSRQEYWSGLPFPSPEDLPNPGIEPRSPTLQAESLPSEPPGKTLTLSRKGYLPSQHTQCENKSNIFKSFGSWKHIPHL